MITYIVELAVILLCGDIVKPNSSKRGRIVYVWLMFLMLVFISGFRAFTVGTDTQSYVRLYNTISYIDLINNRFQIGFMIYLKLLSYISKAPEFLVFVSSCICIGSVCFFVYKKSKDPMISLFLYITLGFYFSQMNIMRQDLALAVTLIGFYFLVDEKYVKSVVWLVLGVTLHSVAIVEFLPFFLILFFGKRRDADKTVLTARFTFGCALLVSVIGFAGYSIVMIVVNRVLPSYAIYFNSAWSDANYSASFWNSLVAGVFLVAGVLSFKKSALNRKQQIAIIMVGCNLVFSVLSMRMEVWNRIASMFGIYIALLWVPEFVAQLKIPNNRRIIKGCICAGSFLYMMVTLIFRPEWVKVVPYINRLFM